MYTSKLRIKLFSEGENPIVLSDRLVNQGIEFENGPTEKHSGPLSLEVNLANQSDVKACIEYLSRLCLDLPLVEKKKAGRVASKVGKMLEDKEPLNDLLKLMKLKPTCTEELIDELRNYNFKFVSSSLLEDINIKQPGVLSLKEKDKKLSFMVRLIKQAKSPENDKYDLRLAFGVDLEEPQGKVIVYLWGKRDEPISLKWKKTKNINTKKKDDVLMTFPDFMDYEMRARFRKEHREWLLKTHNGINPENAELSKFYSKWKPYVIIK